MQRCIVPYYQTTLTTHLLPAEVESRINAVTTPRSARTGFAKAFSLRGEDSLFIGEASHGTLRLQRTIRYRNSFVPQIRGRIVQGPVGADLQLRMFIHPFTALFTVVWLGILGSSVVAPGADIWLAIMLLGFLAMAVGGFFYEAFKARRILQDLLERP